MKIAQIFPLAEQLKTYTKSDLRADLFAGITVGVMLVPQGMAYAYLAGVPPIYGLYAGVVPLIIYALLGTSRQMSLGPVAISSILLASGIGQLALPGSSEYISLIIAIGLLIGLSKVVLGIFKLGFFVNFLSHPVVSGFTSAAAIIIAITQLKDAFGIAIPALDQPLDVFIYAISHISETNVFTFLMCFGSILLMLVLRRISRSIPDALIVVIIGTLLVRFLHLDQKGIDIIRDIPVGLPNFEAPHLSVDKIKMLVPTLITVTIISIVECLGIAKAMQAKHKNYTINANKELIALGFAKIFGSFFQSIPTSGSFSRTAVNSSAGAKSTIASLVTSLVVILVLVALTPFFYYLPKAILAAIILLAVKGLFDYKEAINLWKTHRSDLLMMIVTFTATLVLGIEKGVFLGVILSILVVLYKSSRPHISILGNISGTTHYRNVNRYKGAKETDNTLIIRFDDQLYFGNCDYFKERVNEFVKDSDQKVKFILIDAGNIHAIDSSGIHVLKDLDEQLKIQGIELHLCRTIGPVRDILFKSGLMQEPEKHHMNIHEAVQFIKKRQEDENYKNALADVAMQAVGKKNK